MPFVSPSFTPICFKDQAGLPTPCSLSVTLQLKKRPLFVHLRPLENCQKFGYIPGQICTSSYTVTYAFFCALNLVDFEQTISVTSPPSC